jgi:hypothetical protein
VILVVASAHPLLGAIKTRPADRPLVRSQRGKRKLLLVRPRSWLAWMEVVIGDTYLRLANAGGGEYCPGGP